MASLLKMKRGTLIQDKNLITETASQYEFTFGIQNFDLLNEPGGIINSPTFGDSKCGEKWRVTFFHDSQDIANSTLHLVHSKSKEKIHTTFQICGLDESKLVKWAGAVLNQVFLEGRKLLGETHQKFCISTIVNPKNGYLVDGSVTFYVKVVTRRRISKSFPESELQVRVLSAQKLKSFLLSEKFSDVVLTCGNSQFRASKIVLAAQSPVFLAMFNSEMQESESNAVVKIEDFSDEIIKAFLEFLYTGQTESLEENAGELLKISDKYQVLRLKGKCERILMKNLVVGNAVDILVLGHLYSPEKLKPKIMYFVNNHFKQLKSTESFQRVKKEYPQLIFDLYEAIQGMN